MIRRALPVALAALAVTLFVSTARADDTPPAKPKGHRGTIVSVDAKSLVVSNKKDGQKTYDVSDKVKVVIDGQPGKIEDLAAGDKISYKTNADGKVTDIHRGKAGGASPAPSPTPAPKPDPSK